MDCSTPGFLVHHQLPELAQTDIYRVGDAIQPFSFVPFSCLQSFPASGFFPVSQFFASGGQSIGVSASASVLPINIQDWFPYIYICIYFTICIYYLMRYLFRSLICILVYCLFSCCWVLRVLCILWIPVLYYKICAHIFPQSVDCVFIPLTASSGEQII